MSHQKLFPNKANRNRASAGSEKGFAGRLYPALPQISNTTSEGFRLKEESAFPQESYNLQKESYTTAEHAEKTVSAVITVT